MEATIQDEVAELKKQKAALDAELEPLLGKVRDGSTDPGDLARLTELADEVRDAKSKLEIAEREAQEEEAQAVARLDQERRTQFAEAIAEGTVHRQEFEDLFRATCLVFGRFCASVDKAGLLANQLGHWRIAGQWPEHRNTIDELTKDIDPLPLLRDSLKTRTGFGWNSNILVCPLEGK